jgi:hypothetical protein
MVAALARRPNPIVSRTLRETILEENTSRKIEIVRCAVGQILGEAYHQNDGRAAETRIYIYMCSTQLTTPGAPIQPGKGSGAELTIRADVHPTEQKKRQVRNVHIRAMNTMAGM